MIFGHVLSRCNGGANPTRAGRARIDVVAPPEWTFGAQAVQLGDVARLREARVEAAEHAGNPRVEAVPHDPAALIQIEAKIEERLGEATRLRVTHRDDVRMPRRSGLAVPAESAAA